MSRRIKSLSDFTEAADGSGVVVRGYEEMACDAIIHCGRGHQNKGRCDVKGKHNQHHYEGPNGDLFWSKMEATSGFFDESPEEQDPNLIQKIEWTYHAHSAHSGKTC